MTRPPRMDLLFKVFYSRATTSRTLYANIHTRLLPGSRYCMQIRAIFITGPVEGLSV